MSQWNNGKIEIINFCIKICHNIQQIMNKARCIILDNENIALFYSKYCHELFHFISLKSASSYENRAKIINRYTILEQILSTFLCNHLFQDN